MNSIRNWTVVLVALTCLNFSIQAQTVAPTTGMLERNFTGASKESTPQGARRDIMEQAYNQVSEDLIKELIGEDRFARNKTQIKTKIIKNAARYIPFSRPSDLLTDETGSKMSVALRVSVKDLKVMLQENGLLNENESTPVVIPTLNFVDRVSMKSYRWWQNTDATSNRFLISQSRNLEGFLRASFQKNGFYLLKPQDGNFLGDVPSAFQNEKINTEDAQFLGQYFQAGVLLDGQFLITKNPDLNNSYRIEIKLAANQISNSRPIADVSRRYDTEAGTFEIVVDKKMKEVSEGLSNDLASQVFEAWQRGSLGTSTLRLTLTGKMSLPFLEALKEKMKTNVPQIRNMRERLFGGGKYSFEIDTASSAQELAQKLQGLEIDGRKLDQIKVQSSEASHEISAQIN